ncbi:MAG: c-type cytochrome biogenesis protein CcmI [Ramlibacter sp.]
MTVFLIAAAACVALVLLLLLRPFLWKTPAVQTSRRQLNAAIYREQIAKLEQDLADGTLGAQDHAQARAELQRRALQDTDEEDAVGTMKAPRKTLVALLLVVPIAAFGLYALIGNPAGMSGVPAGAAVSNEEVERMVQGLAKKLESEPDNQKGWALLARSYKVMGRTAQAEIAYERAGAFIDNDAQMLASYADTAAANAGGKFAGKPAMLIAKALKADPDNPMALWLAGTAALEAKQYDKAVAIWQRLAAMLPPGSEDALMLQGAIGDVSARMGNGGPRPAPPMIVAAPSSAAPGPAASVSGTVELDASLNGKAAATDTVMVIARAPGTRMPLAVLRVSASSLPLKFKLDDSLSMSPQALLSGAAQVEVEARISKSGQARPQPGDLISNVQTVKVGASGIALRVAQVRN